MKQAVSCKPSSIRCGIRRVDDTHRPRTYVDRRRAETVAGETERDPNGGKIFFRSGPPRARSRPRSGPVPIRVRRVRSDHAREFFVRRDAWLRRSDRRRLRTRSTPLGCRRDRNGACFARAWRGREDRRAACGEAVRRCSLRTGTCFGPPRHHATSATLKRQRAAMRPVFLHHQHPASSSTHKLPVLSVARS